MDNIRAKLSDRVGSAALSKRRALQVFSEIDENDDGFISPKEFARAMRNLKVKIYRCNRMSHTN